MAGWNTVSAAHAIAQLHLAVPARAIKLATDSGQDTDTVAPMVGAMLGAVQGTDVLPTRWIVGLQHRKRIMNAAETMFVTAMASLNVDSPYVVAS